MSDLSSTIDALLAEYRRLRECGDCYSASVRLGEIINCIRHRSDSDKESNGLLATIAAIDLSIGDITEIQEGVRASFERIVRILGVGTRWEFEEIVLIVGKRVEASMALEFLLFRGIDVSSIDISDADEAIEAYAATADGKQQLREASQLAKRNWGAPLSHWLLDP